MKQLTYILGNRADLEAWRKANPEVRGTDVKHIPNEYSARGVVAIGPPPVFVVLPSADRRAISELHFRGFDVPICTAPPAPYPLTPSRVIIEEVDDPVCRLLEEWMLGPGNANGAERLSHAVQCHQLSLTTRTQFILQAEEAMSTKGKP